MPIPEEVDREKLAEVALAMLYIASFREGPTVRAWRGLDWDVLNLLHEKEWIQNPKNKNKSVVLTEKGCTLSEQFFSKHFVR